VSHRARLRTLPFQGRERKARFLSIALFTLAACARGEPGPPAPDVHITIEQSVSGPWRVSYDFAEPQSVIDLGSWIGGYRERHWRIETGGAALRPRDGRDVIALSAPALRLIALVDPAPVDLRKDYDPFTLMGDGGVLIYTGHFLPFAKDARTRLAATLTIIASDGGAVSAFGVTARRFETWKSPFDHPAFVYAGPATPVRNGPLSAIVDASAPDWIKEEVKTLAPNLADALTGLLGASPVSSPDIFVAMGDRRDAGKLSYSGDALPGQYQMTLAGGAWLEPSEKAAQVLRRSTAHEAAHLWQYGLHARADDTASWIHEGGAEALAAETLRVSGYWSADDVAADLARAKAQCATGLEGRSLGRAEADGAWDAVYACGQVLFVLAAGRAGPAPFWRAFVDRARAAGGYDEAIFFALAAERAGPEFASALQDITRVNNARPGPIIDALFAKAPA
jgi:hypothetical protein